MQEKMQIDIHNLNMNIEFSKKYSKHAAYLFEYFTHFSNVNRNNKIHIDENGLVWVYVTQKALEEQFKVVQMGNYRTIKKAINCLIENDFLIAKKTYKKNHNQTYNYALTEKAFLEIQRRKEQKENDHSNYLEKKQKQNNLYRQVSDKYDSIFANININKYNSTIPSSNEEQYIYENMNKIMKPSNKEDGFENLDYVMTYEEYLDYLKNQPVYEMTEKDYANLYDPRDFIDNSNEIGYRDDIEITYIYPTNDNNEISTSNSNTNSQICKEELSHKEKNDNSNISSFSSKNAENSSENRCKFEFASNTNCNLYAAQIHINNKYINRNKVEEKINKKGENNIPPTNLYKIDFLNGLNEDLIRIYNQSGIKEFCSYLENNIFLDISNLVDIENIYEKAEILVEEYKNCHKEYSICKKPTVRDVITFNAENKSLRESYDFNELNKAKEKIKEIVSSFNEDNIIESNIKISNELKEFDKNAFDADYSFKFYRGYNKKNFKTFFALNPKFSTNYKLEDYIDRKILYMTYAYFKVGCFDKNYVIGKKIDKESKIAELFPMENEYFDDFSELESFEKINNEECHLLFGNILLKDSDCIELQKEITDNWQLNIGEYYENIIIENYDTKPNGKIDNRKPIECLGLRDSIYLAHLYKKQFYSYYDKNNLSIKAFSYGDLSSLLMINLTDCELIKLIINVFLYSCSSNWIRDYKDKTKNKFEISDWALENLNGKYGFFSSIKACSNLLIEKKIDFSKLNASYYDYCLLKIKDKDIEKYLEDKCKEVKDFSLKKEELDRIDNLINVKENITNEKELKSDETYNFNNSKYSKIYYGNFALESKDNPKQWNKIKACSKWSGSYLGKDRLIKIASDYKRKKGHKNYKIKDKNNHKIFSNKFEYDIGNLSDEELFDMVIDNPLDFIEDKELLTLIKENQKKYKNWEEEIKEKRDFDKKIGLVKVNEELEREVLRLEEKYKDWS